MTAQVRGTDIEILGQELVNLGYNINETDDHVVCPRFKDKNLAAYPQGAVDASTLRQECQKHKDRMDRGAA